MRISTDQVFCFVDGAAHYCSLDCIKNATGSMPTREQIITEEDREDGDLYYCDECGNMI